MNQEETTSLMSNLTINNTDPTTTNIQRGQHHLSLSQLPYEIKENIVHWLDRIDSEDTFTDDGSDIEEVDHLEFTDQPRNNLEKSPSKTTTATKPSPSSSPDPPQENPSDKKNSRNTDPILALSLVDRTFYELCRPIIWKNVDLEDFNLTKLREFRSQVLVRQAEYVRSLWWRTSRSELEEYEPVGWRDEKEQCEWDPDLRSFELLGILRSCKKITQLDIDLYSPSTNNRCSGGDRGDYYFEQESTDWQRFVYPVSRLVNLTAISITAAGEIPFQESFLVRLTRDMNQLESFGCCSVCANAPNMETSNSISTCRSPLALHLASLTSLKGIDLDQAECFDLSWSTIEWKGNLDTITLSDCPRASLRTIHQFCTKFSSSLITLELDDIPTDQANLEKVKEEINSGKYRFELPKLRSLSITNELPISFLRLFEDSKNIHEIDLDINTEITCSDIENIVVTKAGVGFTSLKKLTISLVDSTLTMGDIEALELFYLSKGVALEIQNDDDQPDDDDDDEEGDEDSYNDSVDYQLEVELDNEWDEDDDQDFDDDDFD